MSEPGLGPLAIGPPIPVRPDDETTLEATVRSRAARLVREASKRIPGWGAPPFDPAVLARAVGVAVHFTPELRGVDALIVHRRGRFHILANDRVKHPGRRAFTVAHELGHLFFDGAEEKIHLRTSDRAVYDRTPEGRLLERMCDVAASELLMPTPWFDDAAEETGFTAAAAPCLAALFGVSLEATALRMLRARPAGEAAAIGFFEFTVPPSKRGRADADADPDALRYRVRRVYRTGAFPFLFPEGKSVPRESVIYRASLGASALESVESFELGRTARRLQVNACPLHADPPGDEPPTVCAVFRPA